MRAVEGIHRWMSGCWAIFEKDVKLELRSRYSTNTMLLFVLAALFLVVFSVGFEALSPRVHAALLWIVILFAASLGLGRSFVSEEERGTVLLLMLNTRGSMVYTGKLVFNFIFVLAINLLAVAAFIVILSIEVTSWALLLATVVLGALGLAGATTLLAAIIARTSSSGPLLPVLVFPVLVPLLLAVVTATRHAFAGGEGWSAAANDVVTIIAYCGVVISASVLLFDYVWDG